MTPLSSTYSGGEGPDTKSGRGQVDDGLGGWKDKQTCNIASLEPTIRSELLGCGLGVLPIPAEGADEAFRVCQLVHVARLGRLYSLKTVGPATCSSPGSPGTVVAVLTS